MRRARFSTAKGGAQKLIAVRGGPRVRPTGDRRSQRQRDPDVVAPGPSGSPACGGGFERRGDGTFAGYRRDPSAMSLRRLLPLAPLTNGDVTLRRPEAGDLETIARYIVSEDAQAWLSGSGGAHDLYSEYTAGWTAPDEPNRFGLTLVVSRADEGTLVGVMHLDPCGDVLHVSYGVAPDHRRVGVASGALALCSAWAIDNGFSGVELEIGEDNHPSQAVARRCGFEPTTRTRTQVVPGGEEWCARAWRRDR